MNLRTTTRLAVYCRVSSDEQRTGGNIRRQIEQARVEIERLGLLNSPNSQLISWDLEKNPEGYFVDEAYNLEEITEDTAFFALIEQCKFGTVDTIYVDNVDRIFRSRSHTVRGTIMDLLEEYEIQLYTPSGLISTSMTLQIMAMMGAEDKKQTLRKLHIGKLLKVKTEGRPPNGRCFYGYTFDKKDKCWVIIEEEAKVVRWIVAMSAGRKTDDMPELLKIRVDEDPNGVSDIKIIDSLNSLGFNLLEYYKRQSYRKRESNNPSGHFTNNWLYSCIYREDRYAGSVTFWVTPPEMIGRKSNQIKKDAIKIKIPAIISQEEWDTAISARKNRADVYPRHQVQEYLLQGTLHCFHCGGKMGSRAKHHARYVVRKKKVVHKVDKYYTCQRKKSGITQSCNHKKYHRADDIDEKVLERVQSYLKEDVLQRIISKGRSVNHLNSDIERMITETTTLDLEIEKISKEKGIFLTHLGKGSISEQDWISQRERLEKSEGLVKMQKKTLEKEIQANKRKIRQFNAESIQKETLEKYKKCIDSLSFKENQKMILTLVDKVTIQDNGQINLVLKS